eukprot:c53416_g1_i1.p2 GENE.c53416_g1_i1~~c53416_g1_i1.p2  ORF type:complete len:138 (+),score=21.01 c53416_g1_i1:399-812(+)
MSNARTGMVLSFRTCCKSKITDLPLRILDIGCGSGAIGLALASALPNARCLSVDINPVATLLTATNAHHNGLGERVQTVCCAFGDLERVLDKMWNKQTWFSEGYHLIVSNPPYIPTANLSKLDPGAVGGFGGLGWRG